MARSAQTRHPQQRPPQGQAQGTRQQPPRSGRPAPTPPPRSFPLWPVLIGVVLLLGLVVIIVAAVAGNDSGETGGSGDGTVVEDTAGPVEVTGESLPRFTATTDDPAIGTAFPTLTGTGLDGEAMTISGEDGPALVIFLAHWCPHCQREVPVVQEWVDAGNLPDDVELVTVSTSIDPSRPNYPPSTWLAEEGWTAPTLIDPDSAAAQAAGLSAFPFFVAVDVDGGVVARTSGELTTEQLDQLAQLARGGSS